MVVTTSVHTNSDQHEHGAPSSPGDLQCELLQYLQTGLDGFFTDQADLEVRARAAFLEDPRT